MKMQFLIKNLGRLLVATTLGVMTVTATATAADLYKNDKSHWLYLGCLIFVKGTQTGRTRQDHPQGRN